MALNPQYVPLTSIYQYFVNKDTGEPLSNGYIKFYKDNARNQEKFVYELSGTPPNYGYTSLGSTVTLNSVGVPQDDSGNNIVIYGKIVDEATELELELYYIEIYSALGHLQDTIEGWPNITAADDPTNLEASYENQLSNFNFTNVFLNTGVNTFNLTGDNTIPIAADWDLVTSGTGTVVIERIPITGNDNIVTNPPYLLDISTTSFLSYCYLRQRFKPNSGLWTTTDSNDVYLTGSYVARNEAGGTAGIEMYYAESTGSFAPIPIVQGTFTAGAYSRVTGSTATAIPASSNSFSGNAGYVDIYLSLTPGSHVRVGAVQLIPTTSPLAIPPVDLNSSNRDKAYQGDYYLPRLAAKRIPSYLIGWDFPRNPNQFARSVPVALNTASADYLIDQTIAQRAGTGTVNFAFNNPLNSAEFTVTGTNNSFYIMQYLPTDNIRDFLTSSLSVNVNAWATTNDVTMRVYLFRAGASGSIPTSVATATSAGTIVSTLNTNGTIGSIAANWFDYPRFGLDSTVALTSAIPVATLNAVTDKSQIDDGSNDFGFNGWKLNTNALVSDTSQFAIVVTFGCPTATTVNIGSVSLIPGDIPCRPAVQDSTDVLRECQYFYQKSFLNNISAAQNVGLNNGELYYQQILLAAAAPAVLPFTIRFTPQMRTVPTITLYNPQNTNGLIRNITRAEDWGATGTSTITAIGFNITGTTSATAVSKDISAINYLADARLGRV